MSCRRLYSLFLVAVLTVSAGSAGFAAEPGELELKTEKVIVFKDGYALIIKQGQGTTDAKGQIFTEDVPDAAVLGSFWAVPNEGRLISMLAGWRTIEESESKEVPCQQPIEILLTNEGKPAKVELDDKTIYSGVIHKVLAEKTETAVADTILSTLDFSQLATGGMHHAWHGAMPPGAAGVRVHRQNPSARPKSHTLTTISGSHFILRTDEGDVFLPVANVRSVVVKEMKHTIEKAAKSTRQAKRLTFTFDNKDKEQSLTLMYFRPGIRWIPTYRVQLNDDAEKKTASMSLQAELLNEAEDLVDVPVDIVVGVPNFRFRDTPSPLVLEATLRNALAQAAPQIMGMSNSVSNAMFTQRSGEHRNFVAGGGAEGGVEIELPGELTASGTQDLFVYNLPKLTLGQGERCAVPIFSTQVPYRDVYTWDVQFTRADVETAPSGSGIQSPLRLAKNQVWHQIALVNNTNVPWTTGAAMILQGNQPLAQELLTYTPPKDQVRVPLTVAVDLRGTLMADRETARQLQAVTWGGYNYARIAKEMHLELCNNKSIEIDTEITVRVGGKVEDASDKGEIALGPFHAADWENYQGHPSVNNSSTVTWRLKLKPGDCFRPTIKYHYFARH
jgi:hypothetical protein